MDKFKFTQVLCLSETVNDEAYKKPIWSYIRDASIENKKLDKENTKNITITWTNIYSPNHKNMEKLDSFLPQNYDELRCEYLQLDNQASFDHLPKQHIIFAENILCKCFPEGNITYGSIELNSIEIFLKKLVDQLEDHKMSIIVATTGATTGETDENNDLTHYDTNDSSIQKIIKKFNYKNYQAEIFEFRNELMLAQKTKYTRNDKLIIIFNKKIKLSVIKIDNMILNKTKPLKRI